MANKKLEELNLSQDGDFENNYNRLTIGVKEKENRDIQQLLPKVLCKGIRNNLDDAGHAEKLTPKETKQSSTASTRFD